MCPPSSNLPRFYSSDASAYTFFRTVRAPLSQPTPRRPTSIKTTGLRSVDGAAHTDGQEDQPEEKQTHSYQALPESIALVFLL